MSCTTVHIPARKPSAAYSCSRCFERKVKCDKKQPCTACVRHNVDCVFRSLPPQKRRKQLSPDQALLDRLNRYESLLRQQGIDPEGIDKPLPSYAEPTRSAHETTSSTVNDVTRLKTAESMVATGTEKDPSASQLVYEEGRSINLEG